MNKKEMDAVLKKIKIAMAERFITQTELAKQIGLTQGAISAWFKGRGSPDLETLMQVAEVLNKPINYFFADVKGNGNAVGNGAQVNSNGDLKKDIELLSTQIKLLATKMELIESKIQKLEKK